MQELKIVPPEGHVIDEENSTFGCIKFKKKESKLPEKYEDLNTIDGFYVDAHSVIGYHLGGSNNYNVFKTKEQAKACIALAQLSQLMHVYNEGWIPDWSKNDLKYVILFFENNIKLDLCCKIQQFLAFASPNIRNEFLKNFKDLIMQAKPLL